MIAKADIAELEAAAKVYVPHVAWTKDQLAVLRRFYCKVSMNLLASKLHRTPGSCQMQAQRMGLCNQTGLDVS